MGIRCNQAIHSRLTTDATTTGHTDQYRRAHSDIVTYRPLRRTASITEDGTPSAAGTMDPPHSRSLSTNPLKTDASSVSVIRKSRKYRRLTFQNQTKNTKHPIRPEKKEGTNRTHVSIIHVAAKHVWQVGRLMTGKGQLIEKFQHSSC